MSKLNNFINEVATVLSVVNADSAYAKEIIGDSLNNHRTLTVNQLVRYLSITGDYTLSVNVSLAYNKLRPNLKKYRNRRNNRSDAFDVNEFFAVLNNVSLRAKPTTKQSLSKALV